MSELTKLQNVVLATGGGAVISAENRRELASNGTVIYLRASPSDLWQRTRNDRNRPLLQTADPLGRLEQLFLERDPLYREIASIIEDTGSQSVRTLAQRLQQRLQEHVELLPPEMPGSPIEQR